jgi:hypothetical protein
MKRIKNGFYLSPDGLHIVEVYKFRLRSLGLHHCVRFNIFTSEVLSIYKIEILLSSWARLS